MLSVTSGKNDAPWWGRTPEVRFERPLLLSFSLFLLVWLYNSLSVGLLGQVIVGWALELYLAKGASTEPLGCRRCSTVVSTPL